MSCKPSFAHPRAIAAADFDHFDALSANHCFHLSSILDAEKNRFLVGLYSILVLFEIVLRGFNNSVASYVALHLSHWSPRAFSNPHFGHVTTN